MNIQYLLVNYIPSFFNRYLSIQRGLSVNTIQSYRDSLKLFFCYVADKLKLSVEQLSINNLNEDNVLDFLEYLEKERQVSINTRNNRLAAIRVFFKFIGREEPALLDQVRAIRTISQKKTQRTLVTYLEEDELKCILKSIETESILGLRDKALILLLYNTGARAQEVVDLKVDDLRLDELGQVKLLGKGRKQRACPIWPETVEAIQVYLTQREQQGIINKVLILNNKGENITRFGIRYIVKKYASIAEEKYPSLKTKKIGPHTFRHSTAMHLLRAGNDLNMVQMWLGHSNINTTHQYVELDMKMKRDMLLKSLSPEDCSDKKKPAWKQDKILDWLEKLTYPGKLCEEIS